MKIKSMIMVVIMMLCIPINAQTQIDKTLVVYFSATGTTEKAAKLIVEVTGGTLYEIQPEKEYVTADLDWHNKSSRSSVKMSNAKSKRDKRTINEFNLAKYINCLHTFIPSNSFKVLGLKSIRINCSPP